MVPKLEQRKRPWRAYESGQRVHEALMQQFGADLGTGIADVPPVLLLLLGYGSGVPSAADSQIRPGHPQPPQTPSHPPSSPPLFYYLFIYLFLATLCGMRDLSSPTRDPTRAPCSGSVES